MLLLPLLTSDSISAGAVRDCDAEQSLLDVNNDGGANASVIVPQLPQVATAATATIKVLAAVHRLRLNERGCLSLCTPPSIMVASPSLSIDTMHDGHVG